MGRSLDGMGSMGGGSGSRSGQRLGLRFGNVVGNAAGPSVAGGGWRGGPVTRARHPFYAPLPDELVERGGDGGVAEGGAFSDAGLGERDVGFGEDVEDAPRGGLRLGRFVLRGFLSQPQGGPSAVVGEFDLDVVEAGDLTAQGGGTIRLENVSVDDLDAADFAFYDSTTDPDGF